jgi:leucyl aminopeptidase
MRRLAVFTALASLVVAVPAAQAERPIAFAAQPADQGALVLLLGAEGDLAQRGAALADADRAAVGRALASARFGYGVRDSLTLRGIGEWSQIVVVGAPGDISEADQFTLGATLARALSGETGAVSIMADGLDPAVTARVATGAGVSAYRFAGYGRRSAERSEPSALTFIAPAAQTVFEAQGMGVINGMALARDLSNEPPNVIYPETFVERTRAAFAGVRGVQIEVLDERQMEQLGMGAIISVGQGSERPPRMMIVRYRGAGSADQPIVLAGKGITFDSGGLNLKTGGGMGAMKMDMSGAASVMGATLALAQQGAPVHVVAIAALAENMPGPGATRPSDVVTAMNGLSIEVTNTDAEGRMVLADALSYAEARLNPAAIVDVATLTGAVSGALGRDYAGLFSRHDALADQLAAAGQASGEPLWRLPMHPSYAEAMSSNVADLRNSGTGGPGAGTGAHFISRFVNPETPWAHLDIAGVAWDGSGASAGYSVRLLEAFVRNWTPVPRGVGEGGR